MKNETGYPSIDKTHTKEASFLQNHPIIPNMSIVNSLSLISSFYRDAIAVDCLDLRITYQELLNTSDILARSFKELGIKKNSIITTSMPNYFQAIAVFLAANKVGAITTFLNPECSIEEVKKYLNEFESPLFVNYDKNIDYNQSIKNDTKVEQIITLNKQDLNIKEFNKVKNNDIGYNDFLSFNDMKLVSDYYKGFINTNFNGNQDALILFTSGSTGNPKSVVLTNQNILASGIYMKNSCGVKTKVGEKCLACVPFTYPYGFATSTLMSLLCGREAILAPNISKDNIEYYLKKNPNYIFGTPALLETIRRYVSDELDLSSLHTFISGGDFLTPAQNEAGVEYFKKHNASVTICNGSGNAETAGASTNSVGLKVNKTETVGKVLVGTDAIIVNPDTMEELKYGEEGLLCVSGKHVFKEYYKNPQATQEAKFVYKGKEYLKTGSLGILSKEGYFTLTGRPSRYYITGKSNKVYLGHLQQVMSYLDCVEKCVAVPKPNDDGLLYESKAYIKLKSGYAPSEELKEYIFERIKKPVIDNDGKSLQLKTFELPLSINFVDTFPINTSEKIDYTLLEQMARDEYEQEKLEREKGRSVR